MSGPTKHLKINDQPRPSLYPNYSSNTNSQPTVNEMVVPKPKAALTGIPREIRDLIYDYIFDEELIVWCTALQQIQLALRVCHFVETAKALDDGPSCSTERLEVDEDHAQHKDIFWLADVAMGTSHSIALYSSEDGDWTLLPVLDFFHFRKRAKIE